MGKSINISIFDLFSIGIGPSSSHTIGTMRAACDFITDLDKQKQLAKVYSIKVDLYGSLALTGKGHGTDKAILMGLEGESPETIDPDITAPRIQDIINKKQLSLLGKYQVYFNATEHLIWHKQESLPLHSNGMRFSAYDNNGQALCERVYYSIGGGFIVREHEFQRQPEQHKVPYPFASAKELRHQCQVNKLTIKDIMLANEKTWRSEQEIRKLLLNIANIMQICINKGCATAGILPGELKLKRRACELHKKLLDHQAPDICKLEVLNWLNVYAMAVGEENAAGGRMVTAPTNGAAGIIPAVLQYYKNFCDVNFTNNDIITFLLTAGAIGMLYKAEASISGAEVGCQGEVGVACSMAAGALTAVLGGDEMQIEKAAEIGMEHNLGLTCDPVDSLVQIPCIERNAMAAVKAVDAASLALAEGGAHRVDLDEVIITMLQTGEDMMKTYKETSQAGLAVNVPEC